VPQSSIVVKNTADALSERIPDFAADHCGRSRADCRISPDSVIYREVTMPLPEIFAAARQAGQQLEVVRRPAQVLFCDRVNLQKHTSFLQDKLIALSSHR